VPEPTTEAPPIELTGVWAHYASDGAKTAPVEAALEDASLVVHAGEILAIVGPNGAGKSTLLRVMAGTLTPDRGDVRLFGTSLATLERREVAREVAFVTQGEEIRFPFTVREVVLMGRAPHQDGWMRPTDEDARVVEEALARCDLGPLAHRSVDQLSGGERKRVAIARAFAQTSRVLLLDEPTAYLDIRHQVALFERLREEARDRMKACVVVTHDLQLAAAHASRVLLVKGGHLVAEGSVDEVLTEKRLRSTFDWPIDVRQVDGGSARVFVPRRETDSGIGAVPRKP
jgi:iron complex transport system ATP-binding protein